MSVPARLHRPAVGPMNFQITVRHGRQRVRYFTLAVEAPNAAAAMQAGADQIPDDIAREADLIEIRTAVDPDAREFIGDAPAV